jgi:hypothetical protein
VRVGTSRVKARYDKSTKYVGATGRKNSSGCFDNGSNEGPAMGCKACMVMVMGSSAARVGGDRGGGGTGGGQLTGGGGGGEQKEVPDGKAIVRPPRVG